MHRGSLSVIVQGSRLLQRVFAKVTADEQEASHEAVEATHEGSRSRIGRTANACKSVVQETPDFVDRLFVDGAFGAVASSANREASDVGLSDLTCCHACRLFDVRQLPVMSWTFSRLTARHALCPNVNDTSEIACSLSLDLRGGLHSGGHSQLLSDARSPHTETSGVVCFRDATKPLRCPFLAGAQWY